MYDFNELVAYFDVQNTINLQTIVYLQLVFY